MRGQGEKIDASVRKTRDGKRELSPDEYQQDTERESKVPKNTDHAICHICSMDYPGSAFYKYAIPSLLAMYEKRYICLKCHQGINAPDGKEFLENVMETRDKSVFLFSTPPDQEEIVYLVREIKTRPWT